jgi:hypothetical protein
MGSLVTTGFFVLGIAGYVVAAVRLWGLSSAPGLALISVATGVAFLLLGLLAWNLRRP